MPADALLALAIPLSPTGTNHAYAPRVIQKKGGKARAGMMHSREHRAWEVATMDALVNEGAGVQWFVEPASIAATDVLGLTFDWHLPDHRGDLDSRLKLIKDLAFDYLAIWVPKANDRRVWGNHDSGHIDKADPRVVLTVRTIAAFNERYGDACTW